MFGYCTENECTDTRICRKHYVLIAQRACQRIQGIGTKDLLHRLAVRKCANCVKSASVTKIEVGVFVGNVKRTFAVND